MSMTAKHLGVSLAILALSAATPAHAASDQQTLIDRARITVDDMKRDKEFGTSKDLLQHARAIMIVPRLYKGGFFIGGEGGSGVMLARGANDAWSEPAFYNIGSASFGLQIGIEQSEMVLFVMSQKALDAISNDQFKVGAGAGLTVVTLGSNVEGATTGNAGADVVTWASSSGAYAGISLNGSVIRPDTDANRAFYGRAVVPQDILYRHTVVNADATPLRQAITSVH